MSSFSLLSSIIIIAQWSFFAEIGFRNKNKKKLGKFVPMYATIVCILLLVFLSIGLDIGFDSHAHTHRQIEFHIHTYVSVSLPFVVDFIFLDVLLYLFVHTVLGLFSFFRFVFTSSHNSQWRFHTNVYCRHMVMFNHYTEKTDINKFISIALIFIFCLCK